MELASRMEYSGRLNYNAEEEANFLLLAHKLCDGDATLVVFLTLAYGVSVVFYASLRSSHPHTLELLF